MMGGEDVIVIDTRTVPEFVRDHVPGAVSVPGAELALRFQRSLTCTIHQAGFDFGLANA